MENLSKKISPGTEGKTWKGHFYNNSWWLIQAPDSNFVFLPSVQIDDLCCFGETCRNTATSETTNSRYVQKGKADLLGLDIESFSFTLYPKKNSIILNTRTAENNADSPIFLLTVCFQRGSDQKATIKVVDLCEPWSSCGRYLLFWHWPGHLCTSLPSKTFDAAFNICHKVIKSKVSLISCYLNELKIRSFK